MDNKNMEELMISLQEAYKETDIVKIATLFHAIGEQYLREGKEEKALVYINRFDELVGSDDDLYEQFHDEEEQASQTIASLQEKDSYRKEIRDWVSAKETELSKFRRMQWNLLTIARLNQLFLKFTELPGFEVFGEFEKMLDLLAEGIYFGCDAEEEEILDDILMDLEDIEMEAMLSCESRISINNRPDFEALDLLGDGLFTHMMLALYGIVNTIEGDEDEEISLDFIVNALHIDYYIRTCEESLYEISVLAEEKNRILADYAFVKGKPGDEAFANRMEEYKTIFLPR